VGAAVASNGRVLVSPVAASFLAFRPLEVGDAAGVFFGTRRLTVPLAR
jgi:hypothetical protein